MNDRLICFAEGRSVGTPIRVALDQQALFCALRVYILHSKKSGVSNVCGPTNPETAGVGRRHTFNESAYLPTSLGVQYFLDPSY